MQNKDRETINNLLEKYSKDEIENLIYGLLIKDIFEQCGKRAIKEIKYFHPNNAKMPNGIGVQRGGYLYECRKNKNSFILSEGIHSNQYGLEKYRGGIIVFSTDVNAIELSSNRFKNIIKQTIETFKNRYFRKNILGKVINKFNKYSNNNEYIGAYTIGNLFTGNYIGDNGEIYSEKSSCIEVNGLSSKALIFLAEYIARVFKQETVLVKDLNKNKIFLVNPKRSDGEANYDLINKEC